MYIIIISLVLSHVHVKHLVHFVKQFMENHENNLNDIYSCKNYILSVYFSEKNNTNISGNSLNTNFF